MIEHKSHTTEISSDVKGGYFFSGYASKFNGLDSHGDTILPGAYSETLINRERPILLRWNHTGPVIGKLTKVIEDEIGLYVEGELSKGHSTADDAAALLSHGAISGLSIGYIPVEYSEPTQGKRILKKIELIEISLVEEPSDKAALVTDVKRSINEAESLKEIEQILKQHGMSKRVSGALISKIHQIKSHSKANSELERISKFRNDIRGLLNER